MDEYEMGVTPGDKALERVISELNSAIAFTGDPRLVKVRNLAEALRTVPNEIEKLQMERERGVRWRYRRG